MSGDNVRLLPTEAILPEKFDAAGTPGPGCTAKDAFAQVRLLSARIAELDGKWEQLWSEHKTLISRIQELEAERQWVKCSEQMPPDNHQVIILTHAGDIRVANRLAGKWDGSIELQPRLWMHIVLPPPPEQPED